MRQTMSWQARNELGHGRVYERARWVLVPIVLALFLLLYYQSQAGRQQLEANLAREVATETAEYCGKWGMPTGTDKYSICVKDLTELRAHAEQRYRDLTGAEW